MELHHIIESVHQMNQDKGESTLHPLITVFQQEGKKPMPARLYKTNLYLIFLKDSF